MFINDDFFNSYLAAPWQTLGHCWRDSLAHPTLISMLIISTQSPMPGIFTCLF